MVRPSSRHTHTSLTFSCMHIVATSLTFSLMHACAAFVQLRRCVRVLHGCDSILAPRVHINDNVILASPHDIGDNRMFATGGRMFASRPREAGPCKEIERSEVTTTTGEIFTTFSSPTRRETLSLLRHCSYYDNI